MKHAQGAFGFAGLIGALALANFGLPAALTSHGGAPEDSAEARKAAFQQRWGDPADRVDYSESFYPNCDAARAAGVAPIYSDEPGYRFELDGDSDGIACEPYRGR